MKLGDFVEINPLVKLQRDKEYPFLDMADVQPFSRTTRWQKNKVFNGSGARFENRDTLFARITPCLENGKITQALNLDKPGFGSTEFYVLRGKKGISDDDFVYYFSQTYRIRKLAEQSMIGASGRQRVERAAFENIEIETPLDLKEQKRITSILSAFDDKIELNNKISQNLEQTAQAIFKEWFVKFKFPDHEKVKMIDSELGKIPEGWKVKSFVELVNIEYGRGPASSQLKKSGYPVYGANGVIGYFDSFNFLNRQIIIGCRGVVGNITLTLPKCIITHNSLVISPGNKRKIFFYYLLRNGNLDAVVGGSAQPQITINDLGQFNLIIPEEELQDKFESIVTDIEQKRLMFFYENQKLAALRDLLLPKLMNGEIEVIEA